MIDLRATLLAARDRAAGALHRLGLTPNALTLAGLVVTLVGAIPLVLGAGDAPPWEAGDGKRASAFPLAAAAILAFGFLLDVLDGAVARVGRRATPFGAILDSTLDRVGDLVLFGACAVHFTWRENLTYVTLSIAAASFAVLVSYVKARAECLVESCEVGVWQRPERCVIFLAALVAGRVPAALWILGTLPALTVMRRIRHARSLAEGRGPLVPRLARFLPWEGPRGSAGYVGTALLVVAFLLAAPRLSPLFGVEADPIRSWLAHLARR